MKPVESKKIVTKILFSLGTAALLATNLLHAAPVVDLVEQGRRIYQEGVLISGAPLSGERAERGAVTGSAAACVQCHRRSGMGSVEGDIQVSPITGRFLFSDSNNDKTLATMDLRRGKRFNQRHDPYTDEALALALREGVNNSGKDMNITMPHFALGEADLKALTAYLKQLSAEPSPGVTEERIQFATVITPDVEPERKKAMVDMMRVAFAQKNGSTAPGRRHMVTAAEMVLRTEHKWDLAVWELQGAPDTWPAQLEEFYKRQPVFALVSGLSNGTWQPVHDFCQKQSVPCWFPSVSLPVLSEAQYPLYFSRGVALEAGVLANYLRNAKAEQRPQRVVQIYRNNHAGQGAAQALKRSLSAANITVEDRVLSDESDSLQKALSDLKDKDQLMLWLRPADIASLEKIKPTEKIITYFSAELSGGERTAFPPAWKSIARLVYPYEMPEARLSNLTYFNTWMKSRKLAIVDEPMQSEVYFALNFLSDTMAEMLDNLYRDYLIERAESMLSRRESGKAEQEARDRAFVGRTEDLLRKHGTRTAAPGVRPGAISREAGNREGTTIYPRLSLAPGQRFASKGAYIVRFDSDKLVAESDWIVP
jgi:hypothetical protein